MQIHFYGLPEKTTVQLFNINGKLIAEAQQARSKDKLPFGVTRHTLTFTPPDKKLDPLLVFTNTGKLESEAMPIRLESEWGNGRPPKRPSSIRIS
jgi:hypothetical protein